MSIGKKHSEGNRGNDLSYRSKVLKGLASIANNTGATGSLNQENTQLQVLAVLQNLLAENKLDFEIKSVKDANGDVFQLRGTLDEETGVFTWDYIDAEGNAYSALNLPGGPQGSVEFLNPDGLLTAIEALLTTIDADTSNLDVPLSTVAKEATLELIRLLLVSLDGKDFATETTSQLINSNVVLGNLTLNGIKSQTDLLNFIATALEVNVTSSVLPTGAATEATLSTLATQATLELCRLLLVDLKANTTNLATQTTLAAVLAELQGVLDVTFTNSSIEVTQGLHNNLNANANLQVGDVDVSGTNPVPVSLSSGVVQGMYRLRLSGITTHIITAGATSMSFINVSDVAATFTDAGSTVSSIEPGEELSFEASGNNTLGSVQVDTPVGSEVVWVAVY